MKSLREVESIDSVITYLLNRQSPLTRAECQRLGKWLDNYVSLHDEKLLRDAFLVPEEVEI